MDVLITKLDGTMTELSAHGIVVRDFIVASPEIRSEYRTIDGVPGAIPYGFTHGGRTITVPFYYKAQDNADYPLLRDDLYRLAAHGEPFYISEMRRIVRNQGVSVLVGGKRYLVRLASEIAPEQTMDYGFGEMQFETVRLPYAESTGTTADLDAHGIDANGGFWAYGMGLIAEDGVTDYTHEGAAFRIYNAGDIAVNPFNMPLKITIDRVAGGGNGLTLTNATTGDVFKYNAAVGAADVIELDGPVIKRNSAQALRNTNRQYITLAPGWNSFTVSGATSVRIAFDFRFYYL